MGFLDELVNGVDRSKGRDYNSISCSVGNHSCFKVSCIQSLQVSYYKGIWPDVSDLRNDIHSIAFNERRACFNYNMIALGNLRDGRKHRFEVRIIKSNLKVWWIPESCDLESHNGMGRFVAFLKNSINA